MTLPEADRGTAFRAVLVDARPERRALMRRVVDVALGAGTVAAEVGSARDALLAIEHHHPDAVILELQPLDEGIATIAQLRAEYPSIVIVVCTFHADRATRLRALSAGADDYLVKPVSVGDLRAVGSARRSFPADAGSVH